MPNERLIRISKLMSLILRHEPEQFAVVLDPEGYTTIDDIVRAMRKSVPDACVDDVHRVVRLIEPDKARFSINGPDIQRLPGSLPQRAHRAATRGAARNPPPWTTSEKALPIIRHEGIHPMRRQYVHLTTSRDIAGRVGGRHGKASVLEIDALRASEAGVAFYRANESFWLTDYVAPEFIL